MARQKISDEDRKRYLYEFPDKAGEIVRVEAFSPDQAVIFVHAPNIKPRRLTSQDAVRLYRSGANVIDATKAPDDSQPELPLQEATSGPEDGPDETPVLASASEPIASETPAPAVSEPDVSAPAKKRALFGRAATA